MISVEDALDIAGERWPRTGQMMCPTGHDRHSPSFQLYEDTNSYYCFGCGVTGDGYGLLALLTGRSVESILRQYGDGFVTTESTRGLNRHAIRESVRGLWVKATHPGFLAIRSSGLELWQRDLLIDEYVEKLEVWRSGIESAPPIKQERWLRDELPKLVRHWLRRRKIGNARTQRVCAQLVVEATKRTPQTKPQD